MAKKAAAKPKSVPKKAAKNPKKVFNPVVYERVKKQVFSL